MGDPGFIPGLGRSPRDLLEKGMATHSRVLAWRIPRTEDSGGLQSMGLQKESDMIEHLTLSFCSRLEWPFFVILVIERGNLILFAYCLPLLGLKNEAEMTHWVC